MTLKARRAERFTMVWEEEEAKILADRIHADAQRL
jgi:hypothetical protein